MPRCAVLGSPIAHSMSPPMHRRAYEHLGLTDWTYEAFDVDEDGIGVFLAGLDDRWRGLSLTMPLKRAVLPYLDTVDVGAQEVGGVNTVIRDVEGLHGFNTDLTGGVAALRERGVDAVTDALVIGAGATAESMVASLRRLGLRRVTIAARSLEQADALAARLSGHGLETEVAGLGPDMVRSAQVVVSTVPTVAVTGFADELVARCDAVFDVVYDPWPTPLATAAINAAVPVISGLDLLAHQAVDQVRLMTGAEIEAGLLRETALEALALHR
ncbi:shikimate dehydrogenase [Mumia flava]|uniref:shikimate dehydrogenase (NADP(+)) n=1 Tax=Mumia flava TaxID=1348852 RepID=A0A0B2B7F8_9ACTN|nr:shikimate dehydrogenase [Mumia flava]PJJ55862.1 shikimate dehydrogenase [Mumia flava]